MSVFPSKSTSAAATFMRPRSNVLSADVNQTLAVKASPASASDRVSGSRVGIGVGPGGAEGAGVGVAAVLRSSTEMRRPSVSLASKSEAICV